MAYSLESAVFGEEFINDPIHQSRWQSFLKKKKAMITVPLEAVMEQVKSFAAPLIDCVVFYDTEAPILYWHAFAICVKMSQSIPYLLRVTCGYHPAGRRLDVLSEIAMPESNYHESREVRNRNVTEI